MNSDAAAAASITGGLLAGIVAVYVKIERRDRAVDRSRGMLARFDDIGVTPTHLAEGYGRRAALYPLPGIRASVESVGQLSRRITATRLAAVGIFALALQKKQDDRSVFLTIEGPGVAIVREIRVSGSPGVQRSAREFAAFVNARALAAEAPPRDAVPPGA